ncbi:hypothetical protein TVAG_011190 [Trichomonas vaginalis G3]|uniref:Uncharacterized protein n=1 Tax=Trichomonas vaginalis (strain ATCC PRA-98 / G3) TaxID=412133 RepID=A2DP44_TRIV3|nr:hypothetical protein TVAGG3_0989070 [Trichomonas vaginalis G3]EAY17893.1 hypothetical protein TVAG_011190 [Trichomonas vaginalis G3]KAI5489889.1 hypothetical protein TVAGG3_0989070 [Trichomonas vaginalis G3]|eukprot:XP_001330028.1 hypothetical protein [Trichomonas vaginalis G3]
MTIISIDDKKVLSTFISNCVHLVWDILQLASMFTCSDDNVIQHASIDFGPNNQVNLGIDWSCQFNDVITKLVVPNSSPNTLFVLTNEGSIHFYGRSANYKYFRSIREINFQIEGEKVIDIADSFSDFLILMTEHMICFYHTLKFKISSVITTSLKFTSFTRLITIPKYPFKFFTLTKHKTLIQWCFDFETGSFKIIPNPYKFMTKNTEMVNTLSISENGFYYLSDKLRIINLSVETTDIMVQKSFDIPIISYPKLISAIGNNIAFINYARQLCITNNGKVNTIINSEGPIIGLAFPSPSLIMYITENEFYSLSIKPPMYKNLILTSSFIDQTKSINFQDMKESGGIVAVRIGQNRIFVINSKDQKQTELYFFENLVDYYITEMKEPSFVLTVGLKGKNTIILDPNHNVLSDNKVDFSEISTTVKINDEIMLLKKNGTLVTTTDLMKMMTFPIHQSAIYHNTSSTICISNSTNIYVFSVKGEAPRETHSFNDNEINLISFDGYTITYLNKAKSVKQVMLSIRSGSMTNIHEKPQNNFPTTYFSNPEVMKNALIASAYIMEKGDQPPDDVSEIKFFFDIKQRPITLLKGENTSRLYRGAFMSLKGVEIDDDMRLQFEECCNSWTKSSRFINSAVMQHFLGDEKSAAQSLIEMKQYELAASYSFEHSFYDIAKMAAAHYAFQRASKGMSVEAASVLMTFDEYHAACHILYNSQYFEKMKACALIGIEKGKLTECKFGKDLTIVDLVPIDEILRISNLH